MNIYNLVINIIRNLERNNSEKFYMVFFSSMEKMHYVKSKLRVFRENVWALIYFIIFLVQMLK